MYYAYGGRGYRGRGKYSTASRLVELIKMIFFAGRGRGGRGRGGRNRQRGRSETRHELDRSLNVSLGANKENQQPENDQQNNSEENKNDESNATGDASQRQPNKATVAEQVNQSSGAGDSRQQQQQ